MPAGDFRQASAANSGLYSLADDRGGVCDSLVSGHEREPQPVHAVCAAASSACFDRGSRAACDPGSLSRFELGTDRMAWQDQLQLVFVAGAFLLECEPELRLCAHSPGDWLRLPFLLPGRTADAAGKRGTGAEGEAACASSAGF